VNLNYYIPKSGIMSLEMGSHTIPIRGLSSFDIDIDRLTATYYVLIDPKSDARPLLRAGGIDDDVINMRPLDIEAFGVFLFDNRGFNCNIGKLSYIHTKHVYRVDLKVLIDKNNIKDYIYTKEEDQGKDVDRFDLMDLE